MKHRYLCCGILLLLLPLLLFAQESVLRLRPYDGTTGSFLNAQIAADTTANHGIIAGRVYELQRGAPYLANASFLVYPGTAMKLRANDSAAARPTIYLYPTGSGSTPASPPGNLFESRGGDIYMKNIILTGYFELIDTNLLNLNSTLLRIGTAGAGGSIYVDSCILTQTNGQHIRTDGAPKNIKITNTIFADMGYLGRSNLGAGKGIDLRDVSVDTVIFVNNTFVNWQDRVIRHYNFSNPAAGTGPIRFLLFDHNTCVNGMSYHGFLSLGNMGKTAIITNNLLLDPFSLGNDTDFTRQAEFVNSGELDPYGGARMNWIFTAPNDTTQWIISNNYYAVSDSGQAFFTQYASAGVTGEGAPLTWHINRRLGADSVNAFTKLTSLTFPNIPKLMTVMNRWYRSPSGGNKTKNTPGAAWSAAYDFDRRKAKYYDDTLNCAYSTSSAAYMGGTGSFPAGDLNWFPTKLAEWASWVVAVEPTPTVPQAFTLEQNYPNPFNPSTKITFTIPMTSNVKLEVFDLLGRKVATLVDGMRQPGEYVAEFDATNRGSGVYIYKLSSPGYSIARKMMLVK